MLHLQHYCRRLNLLGCLCRNFLKTFSADLSFIFIFQSVICCVNNFPRVFMIIKLKQEVFCMHALFSVIHTLKFTLIWNITATNPPIYLHTNVGLGHIFGNEYSRSLWRHVQWACTQRGTKIALLQSRGAAGSSAPPAVLLVATPKETHDTPRYSHIAAKHTQFQH